MQELLDMLKSDHVYFKQLLQQLDEQLGLCTCCENANWALIDHIVNTLCHYPEQKHHLIEDEALDELKRRHWISDLIIESLHRDHEQLHQLGMQAQAKLSPFNLPDTARRLGLATEAALAFSQAYSTHIRTEEELVFPMIEKLVDEDPQGKWLYKAAADLQRQELH